MIKLAWMCLFIIFRAKQFVVDGTRWRLTRSHQLSPELDREASGVTRYLTDQAINQSIKRSDHPFTVLAIMLEVVLNARVGDEVVRELVGHLQ